MQDFMYGAMNEVKIFLRDSVNAGKNPFEILAGTAKLLGELSGEENFYPDLREKIFTIYGSVLKEKFVLQKEIEEVGERLKKIEAAYQNPDFTEEEHKRIGYALESHKKEIERLERLQDDS